ncbi:SRPBCC family protein [Luteipulveratus sp. YIM 133132]|uniref:SRPBCC family protein n=1 Tax=Luteipulveratus flavus TaxID=3031728 RepID=UPI0023AE7AB0|nr:SRPBCC family protein [Luteipulveratus sp. YIM 133132]MDE9364992.1 SRPBCC family protein [Luteipulveratus sp. YIM 133132]
MSNAPTKREAQIVADPDVPTITITREFDAPPEKVYLAWAEPELVKQWMGPRSIDMQIHTWECRTGGSYRYDAQRDGEAVAHFFGSFHEAVPGERLVQTFGFEELPGAVALETMTFEPLDDGRRCRIVAVSVVDSMEAQAGMMASGMEVGIQEGYEKLDELLASGGVR